MTIFLQNQDEIKELLSSKIYWKIEDIFEFTQRNRDLLGFYIRESIVFNSYFIEAIMPQEFEAREFSLLCVITTLSTTQEYTAEKLFKILADVDKYYEWLISAILTNNYLNDNIIVE